MLIPSSNGNPLSFPGLDPAMAELSMAETWLSSLGAPFICAPPQADSQLRYQALEIMYQVSPRARGFRLSSWTLRNFSAGVSDGAAVSIGGAEASVKDKDSPWVCISVSTSFSGMRGIDTFGEIEMRVESVAGAGESEAARFGDEAPLVEEEPDTDLGRLREESPFGSVGESCVIVGQSGCGGPESGTL